MRSLLFLLLFTASFIASAIVIRHDVADSRYHVPETEFPALVDLPHEGHGVLIAPQWIVTAAHATQWHPVEEVMLNGKCRKVERLIVHPGYKKLPVELQSGDAAPAMEYLASSDDIALIKLAVPVTDVVPVALYREDDELGKVVKLIGKGATGNGVDGQSANGQNRTTLRRAFNTIISAKGHWLGYVFDSGTHALSLEGMLGNGDSGGPVLISLNGQWHLAGLASWKFWQGDIAKLRAGIYDSTSYQVRISSYADWIDGVQASDAQSKSSQALGTTGANYAIKGTSVETLDSSELSSGASVPYLGC